MTTGDGRVFVASGASHGSTTINSVTHFEIRNSSDKATDSGVAGSPGIAEEIVIGRRIEVTLYGKDPSELAGLVEAAAANFIGNYKGAAGAAKTITVKNVYFSGPVAAIAAPFKSGNIEAGEFAITGVAQWGASDTWPTMETFA